MKFRVENNSKSSLVVATSSVVSPKENYKSIVVLSGDLDFAGTADEIVLLSGNIRLRTGSRVNKSLVVLSGNLQRENGAFVEGDQIQFRAPDFIPPSLLWLAPYIGFASTGVALFISTIFWIFMHWISGVFAYWSLPKYMAAIEESMRKEKARNFLASILAILFTIPSILLLVISLVGIALLPLYGVLYILFLGLAYIVFASVFGHWLPPFRERKYSHLRLLAGLSVIAVLRLIFPFLFGSIVILGVLFAWGAVLRISFGKVFSRKT